MEDRLGVAVSLVNKIISRFVSDDDHHHHDNAFEAFLMLMNRYQKKDELKNMKEISHKCAQLFDGHSDILRELSYFLTSEIPNFVPKKKRVQRVASKFLVDDGGLEKKDRYKGKRDGQVEFDETNNNFFQCDDYDVVGFKHLEEVRKQLCISVEYFQFLMHFSFRISSTDELETMVAPIVASMVDQLCQKDPELIKKFLHDFVGFCKYVEAHDRDLTADKRKEEEKKVGEEAEAEGRRKRRKITH